MNARGMAYAVFALGVSASGCSGDEATSDDAVHADAGVETRDSTTDGGDLTYGEYAVTLFGNGDGCGLEGWSIAVESASMSVENFDGQIRVRFETNGVPLFVQSVLEDAVLTGTSTMATFEAATEALPPSACDAAFDVTVVGAVESDGTVTGSISYAPTSPCGECEAEQVFNGTRNESP